MAGVGGGEKGSREEGKGEWACSYSASDGVGGHVGWG